MGKNPAQGLRSAAPRRYTMNHTVPCPGCGRMVDIPAGMDACFCTFCGTRVERPAPVKTDAAPADLDTAALASELADLLTSNRALARQFGRTTYEGQFRAYQAKLAPLIIRLEASLPDGPDRAAAVDRMAEAWLDALAALWGKNGRKVQPHYEDQHLMAIFTIPALRNLPQGTGEELAHAVQARWVARWPKSPIGYGSYEEITDGFRKKLCYITSAVCRTQGKGDDCYELTAFRRFRDQVMLTSEEGRALVEEYYRLAPAIVTTVRLCQDPGVVYDQVYREYLLPCLHLLESGDEMGCRDKYVEMVRHMEKTYLPQ